MQLCPITAGGLRNMRLKFRVAPSCCILAAKISTSHLPKLKKIQRVHPELPVFLYDAGHGFNCDQRKDYAPQAASLARQRTLEFFRKHPVDG
jgi:Dienelactone hydrolase and related enzymes